MNRRTRVLCHPRTGRGIFITHNIITFLCLIGVELNSTTICILNRSGFIKMV